MKSSTKPPMKPPVGQENIGSSRAIRSLFVLGVVALAVVPQPSPAKTTFSSLYADISTRACKQQPKSTGQLFVRYRCGKPVAGWQTFLDAEEGTTSLVLHKGRVTKDLFISEYTSGNTITGDKLELRFRNGLLYATVVRLNEYEGDIVAKSTLAVSSMAGSGCLVAIIEPGPNQSTEARQAADKAAALPCKSR